MAELFYFAWVDPEETTFTDAHKRMDEDVFAFNIEQAEGDFAAMQLDIRNPRVGLLAPGRKRWAWLAWNNNGTAVPLFFGRIVGVPDSLQNEIITIRFVARPPDFQDQKVALANSLKVAPYWDDVWFDDTKRQEPDAVLESRAQLFDVDRITHAMTVTDLLVGEEPTITFENIDLIRDSIDIRMSSPPVRAVEVEAIIPWQQHAALDFGRDLSNYLHSQYPNEIYNPWVLTSFTGEGLISSWPQAEANIGGGWSVVRGGAKSLNGVVVIDETTALETRNGVLMPISAPPGSLSIPTIFAQSNGGTFIEAIIVPLWHIRGELVVTYNVDRAYSERVKFVMKADVQDIITLPEDDEVVKLQFNSINLTDKPVLPDGSLGQPIMTDARDRSFIPTARGQQALEFLLMMARASLIEHSRAVLVSFEVPFWYAPDLNCRRSGHFENVQHPHVPGGTATGKIAQYSISFSGDQGQPICTVQLACCVGYGNTIMPSDGDPTYIEDDYIEADYFYRENVVQAVGAGDVGYQPPIDSPADDGLDFKKPLRDNQIVTSIVFTGRPELQRVLMQNVVAEPFTVLDTGRVTEALQNDATHIKMEFLNLTGGPFETPLNIEVTDLVLPKGIDLEAVS